MTNHFWIVTVCSALIGALTGDDLHALGLICSLALALSVLFAPRKSEAV